jgi:hypothetical protein
MEIPLEIESGITKLGCYDKCKELANLNGKAESEHLCGNDYKLEFTFNSPVTYKGDYYEYMTLATDASRYNWKGRILGHDINERCFSLKNDNVILDKHGYDRGCRGESTPPTDKGLCEGVLMRSGSCDWADKSGNLDPRFKLEEDCALNTGHIWISPNLESNCVPFENNNRYLANCTFDTGITINIWTKEDTIDVPFVGKFYCPELLVCEPTEL